MPLPLMRVFILCGGFACAVALAACGNRERAGNDSAEPPPEYGAFGRPERVTIQRYSGDAMEPFLTRDGQYLLFNNRNDPATNTELHYARRVDGLTFAYEGEISGVNTPALEGVASLDDAGWLYFISPRDFARTGETVYRGRFARGAVTELAAVPGLTLATPGHLYFDVEVSATGNVLYLADGEFRGGPVPTTADLTMARRSGQRFEVDPAGARLLKSINTPALEYAAAVSSDELELFFTRLDLKTLEAAIYRASRTAASAPFQGVQRIASIRGFVEAPTLSADGRSLYYHGKDGNRFVLYRVTR